MSRSSRLLFAGWLALAPVARAEDPLAVDAHFFGSVDLSPADPPAGLDGGGLGFSVAGRSAGPLYVHGRLGIARLVGGGSRFAPLLGLRVYLSPVEGRVAAPSLVVEGGLDLRLHAVSERRLRGLVHGGAAVDLRLAPSLRLRLQAGWVSTLDAAGGVEGQVGVVWQRHREPEAAPEVVESLVWRPYPHCDWVSEQAFADRLRALDEAAGAAVQEEEEEGLAPPSGVALGARPGDELWLDDGRVLRADPRTGAVMLPGVSGVIVLRARGGGREDSFNVAADEANTVWLRFDPPDDPWVFLFENNAAALRDDDVAALRGIAANTGGWSWRVEGSFSWDRTLGKNLDLGQARAAAVRKVLVAAGVPAERIAVEVVEPDLSLPAAEQRRAVLRAVPPGEGS